MRIESIEIQNFRQYQSAKLEFKRNTKVGDIHIILGENGEGKTNILNAITWCLYGEESHLGDKNYALPMINSQYADSLRKKNEQFGDVSVTIKMETEEGNYVFMRKAVFSLYGKDPIKTDEHLVVLDPKMKYYEDEESVEMFVYRFAPQDINEYIFFDGEQLDSYFKEGKRDKIESGIKDLTQASIVNKTIESFSRYLKQEINPVLDKADDQKVKSAQKKVNDLKSKVETAEKTVEELENQKADCIKKIAELKEIIKGHEKLKAKAVRMDKIETDLNNFHAQKDTKCGDLMRFVRQYYVYFSIYGAMKKLYDFILEKEKAGNLPPKVDKHLVQEILNTKECPICGSKHLDNEHIEFVLKVLKRLEISSKTSNSLNKASVALTEYFKMLSQYEEEKKNIQSDIFFLDKQIKALDDEYKELSDFMKNVVDSEKVKKAITEHEAYSELKEELITKVAIENQSLAMLQEQHKAADDELQAVLKQNAAYAKLGKQKEFCEESIKVLKRTMTEVLSDCRKELQERTFEIFESLMWKKDTFKEVIIDEDYIFHLLNNFEEETLGSCSAAERGLLALSFTMALQEISRHDSLLYIDTPLGRVGVKNRINFAEILKRIGDQKQIILSFTPSEYDSNVKSILAGSYSSFYELVYNQGLTTVKKI